jgi:putative membrane protein
MRHIPRLVAALFVLAGAAALASPAGNLTIPSTPKDLLNELHHANIAEIQLGQLGQQRASSPEVKQLAQRLQTDHQNADTQLKQVAQELKVSLGEPTRNSEVDKRLDDHAKQTKETLQVLQGAPFDQVFTAESVADHDKDIAMLQAARAKFANTPQITQLIDKLLPTLDQHRQASLTALQNVQPKITTGVGGSGK